MAAYRSTRDKRVLDHRDFAPKRSKHGFFRDHEYESLSKTVSAASEWINEHDIDVVNIETVALPNIWEEEGPQDPSLTSYGEVASQWHQFVRVWFWRDATR